MNELTERQKLELAARAGGIKIETWGGDVPWISVPSDIELDRNQLIMWTPHTNAYQAAELMLKAGLVGIGGADVSAWMQQVFDAAVWCGICLVMEGKRDES